jgi:hypothetical protein
MDAIYREECELQVIVEKFEGCHFKLEEFTHTQHLTVAVWYLLHFDACEALVRMRTSLQRFIEHYGRQGYNETITRFWMELIRNYLDEISEDVSRADTVNRVIARFGSKDILFEYYTRKRVTSETAKREWVEPDLKCISAKRVRHSRHSERTKNLPNSL